MVIADFVSMPRDHVLANWLIRRRFMSPREATSYQPVIQCNVLLDGYWVADGNNAVAFIRLAGADHRVERPSGPLP